MGGESILAYVERSLGVNGLADLTPRALVAIVAARDAAELCLALFGVYAILRAPLGSIGLRIPKVGWLALGGALGLGTGLLFPRLAQELHLQNSYYFQYMYYIMSRATGLIGVASILVYVLFAPLVEEIVFRGIVLQGVSTITNDVVAIVISAAIFAGIHAMGGATLMTAAFLSGLLYGWLYVRTRSIVPSSVAHVIYDALAFYPIVPFWLGVRHF
jgi:membrane protease YdiL (CAAX protease family)